MQETSLNLSPLDPIQPRRFAAGCSSLAAGTPMTSSPARVGVYPETIGNYESGKTRRMSWRTLRDIAAASDVPGVTLDWLIGDWVKPSKGDEMSADPLVIAHPSHLAHA